MQPTLEEKYQHLRTNAELFIRNMALSVKVAEDSGDLDLAVKLRVWCLSPWEAAVRDDDTGELWPTCEACGEPIKDDADRISSDDCCFHRSCIEDDSGLE
jgi:hypothetical protein